MIDVRTLRPAVLLQETFTYIWEESRLVDNCFTGIRVRLSGFVSPHVGDLKERVSECSELKPRRYWIGIDCAARARLVQIEGGLIPSIQVILGC